MGQVLGTGVEFAGYRIEVLIGRGGMSEVYRAGNPRLGNTVAIKLLARELAQDEVFQERFVRESRLAASLNHPNVIPIFDAGEFEGAPYIAMRYVDGPDLKQLIAREGRLGIEYATAILAQVAGALDAAHTKGLIHRDVKPGNILIDEDAGTDDVPHVYLSDFGVAKHSQSRSGLTSTGHFVGTIDYISPEQIEGKPLDGTTDLYSLGCLLYECLTGGSPFDRDTDVAMIYAHLVDPPPSVSDKRPDLPAALDGVISKALSKRPEDRYRTCRELVSAVRATYGADTAGFAVGTANANAASSAASETVLAASTNEIDGPVEPVSAPPTTLSDEAPGAPSPVPPTALASDASTSTPPTEVAGARGLASQETAATGGDETDVIEEPPTLFGSGPSRRRVWPRALVAGLAFLLLAGGAAAAVLITSSGKTTKTHQTTGGGNSGTQSDVQGGVVTPTVDAAKTSVASAKTKTAKTRTTTAARTRRTASTTTAATNRRRQTTTRTATTDRRRGVTGPTTTTSGTDRRRTTTSSGSGGGTTTDRRR